MSTHNVELMLYKPHIYVLTLIKKLIILV